MGKLRTYIMHSAAPMKSSSLILCAICDLCTRPSLFTLRTGMEVSERSDELSKCRQLRDLELLTLAREAPLVAVQSQRAALPSGSTLPLQRLQLSRRLS